MYNVKKKYDNAIGPKQDIKRKEIKKFGGASVLKA